MEFNLNKKDFIEGLLHTPIKTFEIGEGCKKGDNVAGSLKSIVATTESGETISAVIKTFPPKYSPIFNRIKEGQVFRTEVDAYTVLVKEIQDFVKTHSRKNGHYCLPMPKHYDHFNNDENDYICLEDIRPQGYKMPSIFNGLSYSETSLALQELARFHAYTYAYIQAENKNLFTATGKFSRFNYDKWRTGDQLNRWQTLMSGSVQNAIDIIQAMKPSLAKIMKEKIPAEKAGTILNCLRNLTDVKIFPCLAHGDFWSNNMLFQYKTAATLQSTPTGIKFVDFQFTRRGNIFEDVVYFIFTSTDSEFRKNNLKLVLKDYYTSFKNALDDIDLPMPINFTWDFLIDTFNGLTKAALIYMCFAIPLQMGKPDVVSEEPESKKCNKGKENGTMAHSDEDNIISGNNTAPSQNGDIDYSIELKPFIQNLRRMIENSPPALTRLKEITEEILVAGIYNN